jgi:hypothetical protein
MYRLIRFGQVSLQYYNQVDTVGSGSTPTAYQNLPEGGALDLYGSQTKHPGTVERTKSLRLKADTASDLAVLFFQLLALRGKRDRLYRQMPNGDIHWQYARLVDVTAERSYEITKYSTIQDLSLRFVTQEAFWRGNMNSAWTLDSGEYFDQGLFLDSANEYPISGEQTDFTISIGTEAGRAPIRALRITVTAGSEDITGLGIFRNQGNDGQISYVGTIETTKSLIIDTGTMQVKNDGVGDYSNFSIDTGLNLAVWFALEAGDNDITVYLAGGGTGSIIDFSYYEAWY